MKTIATISKEGLKTKIDRGEKFQIVNVLAPSYYHLGFIRGSLKIPLDQLEERLGELDKSQEVVVYCASKTCQASKNAAEKLAHHQFNVIAYEGGIEEWKDSGYPVEA